jgi:hypothetical protein
MKNMFLLILCWTSMSSLGAWDATPTCAKQLEKDFFNEKAVLKSLSTSSYVQMNQWTLIAQEIKAKSSNMYDLVKGVAGRYSPNPLEYPYDQKKSEEVYQEAFFDLFAQVLRAHFVTDPTALEQMFNDLMFQHKFQWEQCFGKRERLR